MRFFRCRLPEGPRFRPAGGSVPACAGRAGNLLKGASFITPNIPGTSRGAFSVLRRKSLSSGPSEIAESFSWRHPVFFSLFPCEPLRHDFRKLPSCTMDTGKSEDACFEYALSFVERFRKLLHELPVGAGACGRGDGLSPGRKNGDRCGRREKGTLLPGISSGRCFEFFRVTGEPSGRAGFRKVFVRIPSHVRNGSVPRRIWKPFRAEPICSQCRN